MIEWAPSDEKLGAIGGLGLLGIWILRSIGLRVAKDLVVLKGDQVQFEALEMQQRRIELLDSRVYALEKLNNRLMSFAVRSAGHIGRCHMTNRNVDPAAVEERTSLLHDYDDILRMTEHFHTSGDLPQNMTKEQ